MNKMLIPSFIDVVSKDGKEYVLEDIAAKDAKIEQLKDVLQCSRQGLLWYIDAFPSAVSEADYEMLESIDDVLNE